MNQTIKTGTTPTRLTNLETHFIKFKLKARADEGQFVSVRPHSKAMPRNCYINVYNALVAHHKINKSSDWSYQLGWAIWTVPHLGFCEAEHHCVFMIGSMPIDITPHQDGEKRIFFVPDHIHKDLTLFGIVDRAVEGRWKPIQNIV